MTARRRPARPPVLVGVDGSEQALRAVRWAAAEAARREVPLRVVHGYSWPDTSHLSDQTAAAQVRRMLLAQARSWLVEAQTIARSAAPGITVTADLRVSHPVELLVHESRVSSLVVVGSRGIGGFVELLLGAVATAITAKAECPVVVVRDVEPRDTGPVVVGVDGSPLSDPALDFALDAARATGAELVAVHGRFDVREDPARPPTSWESVRDGMVAKHVDHAVAIYPDVVVHRVLVRDRPARALLDEAAGARLLVIGSRGRGGITGLLLGSTSQTLLHHAPCPVAVVRVPAPPIGNGT